MSSSSSPLLYHEKQVAALCGQHCLNTLLQGPYFTEIDLAQIAQELDALEQSFMAESGMDTKSYLEWQKEASGNVAEDGMFSIQVLSKALETWNLTCVNLHSPECVGSLQHPEQETAFICNHQAHWLTVRRMGDSWFNFNSLYPAPEFLGTLYLTAFLATLREKGYSIFVVRGNLPQQNHDAEGPGHWFTPEQAKEATKKAVGAREAGYLKATLSTVLDKASEGGRMVSLRQDGGQKAWGQKRSWAAASSQAEEDDDDEGADDMARAIAASLGSDRGAGPSSSAAFEHEDPELAAALAASLADSQPPESIKPSSQDNKDLAAAKLAALDPGTEPATGPDVIDVAFRLPNSERLIRRFRKSERVQELLNFLRWRGVAVDGNVLTRFPNMALSDLQQTLRGAGVSNAETLTLQKKH